MSETERALLHGIFTPLNKMKKDQIKEECQMWRNIWGWIPSAIKYYVSRTGTQIGVSIRNYHRFVGILLDTQWDLKGIEIGVYEKVYDQNDGHYYFEQKIIRLPLGQIVSFDWIKERKTVDQVLAEEEEKAEEESETVT